MISKAVGHPFDDLDLLVDPFQKAGIQRVATMSVHPIESFFQDPGKSFQRLDSALNCARVPHTPEALCRTRVCVTPQVLEVTLEQLHRQQPSVCQK